MSKRLVVGDNGKKHFTEEFRERFMECGGQGLNKLETMAILGITPRERESYILTNEEKYSEYQVSRAMPRVVAKRKILKSISDGNTTDAKRYLEKFSETAEEKKDDQPSLININTYNLILQRIDHQGFKDTEYKPPTDESTPINHIIL